MWKYYFDSVVTGLWGWVMDVTLGQKYFFKIIFLLLKNSMSVSTIFFFPDDSKHKPTSASTSYELFWSAVVPWINLKIIKLRDGHFHSFVIQYWITLGCDIFINIKQTTETFVLIRFNIVTIVMLRNHKNSFLDNLYTNIVKNCPI